MHTRLMLSSSITLIAFLASSAARAGDSPDPLLHADTLGNSTRVEVASATTVGKHPALRLTNGHIVQLQTPEDLRVPSWFKPKPLPPGPPSCPSPPFPAAVSLGSNQTAIRNQGGRNTCTVFATIAATEAAYRRLYNVTLDLSEQYLNHVQKAFWLDGQALLPSPEIQPETNGGGNLQWHVAVLQRYGIAEETALPYIGAADYENTPAGLDDPNLTQKALDDFELSSVPQNYLMPEPLTTTVWPQAALETARYRPTQVTFADASQIQSLDWYRSQLACGREVMIQIGIPTGSVLSGIWSPGNGAIYAGHAVLIVGYDDSKSAFLVKNSWGESDFISISYDWATRGFVQQAGVVLDVAPPSASFTVWENKQLFLGRWNLDHDGWHGLLDLYRLPRPEGDSSPDLRAGTYFGPDGVARRVNAKVVGNRIDFLIDWDIPNQASDAFDENTGLHFTGYLFSWDHQTLAGTMFDNRDGNSYGFHAQKATPSTGNPAAGALGLQTYVGLWNMEHDGWKGTLAIGAVNTASLTFSGTYTGSDGRQYVANGTVSADPRIFSLAIAFGQQPQPFSGFLYGKELQFGAGTTTWANIPFGFFMARAGPAPVGGKGPTAPVRK